MVLRFVSVSIDGNNSKKKNGDNIQFIMILYGLNVYFRIYVNNAVFTIKIRLCSYRIIINYLLYPFFYVIYSFM